MARELVPEDEEQLHHFVSTSPWDGAPLEAELVRAANALAGGRDSFLIVDDTALVKKGTESAGSRGNIAASWARRRTAKVSFP